MFLVKTNSNIIIFAPNSYSRFRLPRKPVCSKRRCCGYIMQGYFQPLLRLSHRLVFFYFVFKLVIQQPQSRVLLSLLPFRLRDIDFLRDWGPVDAMAFYALSSIISEESLSVFLVLGALVHFVLLLWNRN